jgi:undecaprenyl-diphosphooligosaccharide--protein glycosyltransferase
VNKLRSYDMVAYIALAYLFSVAMRLVWVYQFGDYESFRWNDQLMINTNDGYFYMSGALNLLEESLSNNQRVPGAEYGLVYFTYLLAKFSPFSLDTIALFTPAFVSSLIVVPIVLTMRLFDKTIVGFFAALLASITWSFYNRTMTGYFDSDLFALVFPAFILYYLLKSVVEEKKLLWTFVASLLVVLYSYAYDASKSVIFAVGLWYVLYLLVFERKESESYKQIFLISLAMIEIEPFLRVGLVVAGYAVLYKDLLKERKNILLATLVALVALFYFGNVFGVILAKIHAYIDTGVESGNSLKYYQVHQTIREAGKIPFETFANRISGSTVSFVIAVMGYALLAFRKKEFLLFLPLVGIGFFAYAGGLRFTVYAIPAMAIGAVYFFYFIVDRAIVKEAPKYVVLGLMTFALLFPNISHILDYKVPTVFNKDEVAVLDKLKNIASPKDYTLTWWDYGYPIWYYSNTNTLIDGGKHHHDNFIISKILATSSQAQSANLARLSVEEYVKNDLGYSPVANIIFSKEKTQNPNTFLEEMELRDFKLPEKTRDIYLYLPYRMLNIFPTVNVFSNLDLVSGEKKRSPLFFVSRNFKDSGDTLYFENGIKLDKRSSELSLGSQKVKLGQFVVTAYDERGELQVNSQLLDMGSPISVVFMKNYNTFLILDSKMYNSTFIQMFVLENYDKELYEEVIMTPQAKVYRLKR